MGIERLPGFRDFYPHPLPSEGAWSIELRNHIFGHWRETARRYGFQEYDAPPLEPVELYTIKSGDEIVQQLYNFTDKGNREIALRPEMTPSLARMVAAHIRNYKKPLKWFAIPQLFRYERQQKGRLREHFQFNADILGEEDLHADAELIALLIDTLRSLQLTSEDFVVRLSSRNAWQDFFQARCTQGERAYDFYQIIDKWEREDPNTSALKLQQLGFDAGEVRDFIQANQPTPELNAVLENLGARGLADFVRVDYQVIRGLAYYTGVVFEAFDRKGEFRAIAGGGRYDHLVSVVTGGRTQIPALGFGMGDVVLGELLTARGLIPPPKSGPDVFWLLDPESLRRESFFWIQKLRDAGWQVDFLPAPAKADKQFKRAVELGARFTVKIELGSDGAVNALLRQLTTRQEKALPAEALSQTLQEWGGRGPGSMKGAG